MNFKKIGLTIVIAAISGMFFIGNAAAEQFAACTPFKIGPAGANVQIQVSDCVSGTTAVDPSCSNGGWLRLSSTGTDQQLAVILTAMSLNKAVSVGYECAVRSGGYVISSSILFVNR